MSLIEVAMERRGVEDIEGKSKKIESYVEMIRLRRRWGGLVSREAALEPEELIVDSIGILEAVSCEGGKQVVEIGSGGGIVGMVLALICPEWEVSLVESSGRKSAFLAEAKWSMQLGNVIVVRERAERMAGVGEYDVVVTRAAGSIKKVAPVALGLLRTGGRYVALKQSDVRIEVESARPLLRELGAGVVDVIRPGSPPEWEAPGRTSLVVIDKV